MALDSGLVRSITDLEAPPDVESTFHYKNRDDLVAVRDFLHSRCKEGKEGRYDHTVVITGFLVEDINDPILMRWKKLYINEKRTLEITMPGLPHESASLRFDLRVGYKLGEMGCIDDLRQGGHKTTELGGLTKEPDGSWGPRRDNNLTYVLEAAVSESKGALRRDARIWLESPSSTITQVVTVNINRSRPDIVFSLWKSASLTTNTRSNGPARGYIDHEVYVTLENGTPKANGAICICFELLFKRRPRSGTAEKDIVISARELEGVARIAWEDQNFL